VFGGRDFFDVASVESETAMGVFAIPTYCIDPNCRSHGSGAPCVAQIWNHFQHLAQLEGTLYEWFAGEAMLACMAGCDWNV
jgi:hypothetical protein